MPDDIQHISYDNAQRVLNETAAYRTSVPNPDAPANTSRWRTTQGITFSNPARGHAWLGRRVQNATITGAGRWGAQFLRGFDTKWDKTDPHADLHDSAYANAWREAAFGGMRRGGAMVRAGALHLQTGGVLTKLKGAAMLGAGLGRMLGNLGLEQALKGGVLLAGQALRQVGRAFHIVDASSQTNRLADFLDSKDNQAERRKGALRDCMLAIAKTYPDGEKDLALAKLRPAVDSPKGMIQIGDADVIAKCLNGEDTGYDDEQIQNEVRSHKASARSVLAEHALDHQALMGVVAEHDPDRWITVAQGSDGFKTSEGSSLLRPQVTSRGGEFVKAAMRSRYGDQELARATVSTKDGSRTVLDMLNSQNRFTVADVDTMEIALHEAERG